MHYVYVLYSEGDGRLYTGSTGNLNNSLYEHHHGYVITTKFRRPLKLIYYDACLSEIDALAREKYLKSGMGKRYLRNRLKKSLEDF